MVKEESKEKKVIVASQLPTYPSRELTDNEGNEYAVVTIEEALTEILEIARELKKKI